MMKDGVRDSNVYSACFRDDAVTDINANVGVMIAIEYNDGLFSMYRVYTGTRGELECCHDGALEQHWYFSEENTKKLLHITNTDNGKDFIDTIYNRFKKDVHNADCKITEWCEANGIEFIYYYHRELTEQMKIKLLKIQKNL